jgi:hypothetical protein
VIIVAKKKKRKKKKHKRRNPLRAAGAAKAELSHENMQEQPSPDTQSIKPLPPEKSQSRLPVENVTRSWIWWVTGWRLFVELATVLGLAVALYALRPALTVTSLAPSDVHNNNGSKASITVTGTGIKDVTVQCVTNKVIFEGRNTLALSRFAMVDEYSVRDVAAGESFAADCNFAWSLWTKAEGGFFLLGAGVPGVQNLGIAFLFKDGVPSLIPGAPFPAAIKSDLVGYSPSQVTAVDGYFIVLYRWPLSPFRERRVIHMIARRNSGGLQWRVAPSSEPVIADAADGFIVTASGTTPDQWGVTMKRTGPN